MKIEKLDILLLIGIILGAYALWAQVDLTDHAFFRGFVSAFFPLFTSYLYSGVQFLSWEPFLATVAAADISAYAVEHLKRKFRKKPSLMDGLEK